MTVKITSFPLDVGRIHHLGVTQYHPETTLKKVLLISSATAVNQEYYKKFAHFCAEKGLITYTFDYSGFGGSGNETTYLKKHKDGVMGWGAIDQAAMVRLIKERHPDFGIVLVTHSIGGQVIGFNSQNTAFEKIVTVASQSGFWKTYHGIDRLRLWLFWYFFIPFFTPIFGYYPGRIIGIVDNLPKSVVVQWRSWGVKKDYFMHYHSKEDYFFDKVRCPIKMYSFTKDPFASKAGVDWLADQFPNAQIERIHYDKNPSGKTPGHFGFFKSAFKEDFWIPTIEWLLDNGT